MSKKLLFLESFYGGSHKDFADGWIKHSVHDIELCTLPSCHWKWRLRAAALHFMNVVTPDKYEAIICTSMMSISELKNRWKRPIFLYMHESQLSYPLPKNSGVDHHGIHIDFNNCLAADWLVFNSQTHLDTFIGHIARYFERAPEYPPQWISEEIKTKAQVLHPGCQLQRYTKKTKNKRPVIVWNHRWEFDKNPQEFFAALEEVDLKNSCFDLVLLGECGQSVPKLFLAAQKKWGDRILHYGFVNSKKEYISWLQQSDLVISTAIQENFGISIVEAIYYGCFPIVPARLSYPEVLPQKYHHKCLYEDFDDLVAKIILFLEDYEEYETIRGGLSQSMFKYSWSSTISKYDAIF
ncbi:DUF3524 domain-containing protein [Candidatus Uabimicrobium sp. HlEnr_7]|uniref:tRNA-queuosine alpha-mannosyltransferase domain-containing protein n=1 Tax=Candidatus Uabimicrobium helgolandensis TaxID=3095367 RepID=UPI0035583C4F